MRKKTQFVNTTRIKRKILKKKLDVYTLRAINCQYSERCINGTMENGLKTEFYIPREQIAQKKTLRRESRQTIYPIYHSRKRQDGRKCL
ncbi:unnamed protein product [Moneuplotes crassus]|uniref:Uncharacterized protein n=1 Tax=Euplotes crassus TaxID=5936 RepID=A0AAD1XQM6_EUPCR|nr:unnamed protein product [Moneuplotes crassus]